MAAPRSHPGLAVTVEGRPAAIRSALAWLRQDGSVTLTVSGRPRTCAEVTASSVSVEEDPGFFRTVLRQVLRPDGTLHWMATEIHVPISATSVPSRPAGVDGASLAGRGPIAISLAFETAPTSFRGTQEPVVKVSGRLEAGRCASPPEPAPSTGPRTAFVTVSGHRRPLSGAVLELRPDGRRLMLSTGRVTCDEGSATYPSGSALVLTLGFKRSEVSTAELTGVWFETSPSTFFDGPQRLTATPAGAPSGAVTQEIALGGSAEIFGYRVRLEGKVTATVCRPK